MNSEIKVSVLMLTYNQEKYIGEAIRSVILQETNFPFELVIGNDSSKDETGTICRTWKDNYPKQIILLDREQNMGLQQNFIQTYAHCKGKYVAICEGDDFWTNKHKLQVQADFLDAHPGYSTCFHRVINYFEDNGTKSLSNGGQQEDTTIIDLARSNYISNVSAMFRKDLFGPLPEWFAKVSTYDYAIHLLNAQYGKIHYMKAPMAVYRQHRKAIWSEAGTDKKLNISLQVREFLMTYFKENKEVYDALRNAYVSIAVNLIRYGQSTDKKKMVTDTEKRILSYFPDWNAENVRARITPVPLTAKQQLKKYGMVCLKQGRALVSRFIPLPRI